MKVIDKHDPAALRGGDMEVLDIGISTDPEDQMMILNILSSTLYSNKPKAVLREYGCNAYDANVEAGKADTPFTVRLPNHLKQSVAIRDFGRGMTEQEMRKVFCFMGRSTKRESNDFVGMLGIGSKAGFAYGDYFTVTSYSDGVKSIYNCHRDKGVPKMALMGKTPTDEPNGIEVEMPVRQQDISAFVAEAEKVYRYFKVRPKITGATVVFKDAAEIKFKGTGWRYRGDGTSAAIMGNVGYDLNIDALGHDLNEKYRALIGAGVELEFAIGEIEIAPNREGLQYTDVTKNRIKALLDVVIDEVSKVFTQEISTAKSMWEARKLYGEAFEQMGSYGVRTIRDFVKGQITWKTKKIDSGQLELSYQSDGSDGVSVLEYYRPYSNKIRKNPSPWKIYCNEAHHLVENDISIGVPQTRIRGFFEKYTDGDPKLILFRFTDDKAKRKFIKKHELDGAPWEVLSAIPPSTIAINGSASPNQHKSKHSAKVFEFNHKFERPSGYYSRRGEAQSMWWNLADVDLDNGGVFVEIENFLVMGKGAGERCYEFAQKVKEFRNLGLLKVPLYGFKSPKVAKLDRTVWKTLDEHLAEELDALVTKKKNLAQDIADYQAHANYTELFDQKLGQKYLPDGTIARLLVDECYRMSHPKSGTALMQFLQADTGKPWIHMPKLPDPTVDLEELEGKVFERYPMINTANWDSWRSGNRLHGVPEAHVKHIADYISLVESA